MNFFSYNVRFFLNGLNRLLFPLCSIKSLLFPLLVFLHNFVLPVSLKTGNDRCKPYSMCRESPPQHHRRNGFSWMNYKVAFYKMLGYYQIMSSILSCGLFTNPADKPSFSSLLKSSFIFTTSCLITFAFRFVFKGTAATLFTDFFLVPVYICYLYLYVTFASKSLSSFFSVSFLIVFPVLLLFFQILGVRHPLVVFLCKPNSTVIQIY